jgi:O-antigen ligase
MNTAPNSVAQPVDSANTPSRFGWQWAPWFVLAYVALFPAPGYAAAILGIGSIVAIGHLLLHRFRGGSQLLSGPAWALSTVLFLAYFLPQLISSTDSIVGSASLQKSLLALRYLPFLWLVCSAVATPRNRELTFKGLAIIVAVWVVDALAQAVFGTSPLFWGIDQLKAMISGHSMCTQAQWAALDRLSGILGPCNLKLGPTLASLSPFLLYFVGIKRGRVAWVVAAVLTGIVILLAGSRGSWITYALVLLMSGWRIIGAKGVIGLMLAGVLALGAMYFTVPQVRDRIARTGQAAQMSDESVDVALSGRGRIWKSAVCMIEQHPINGVGVSGFREYFPKCDPEPGNTSDWGPGSAYHAHQIILEILSETGIIGLLFWILGVVTAYRAWRYSTAAAKERARPAMWALVATVFPFNTSYAFYSTFWGGLLLLLSALFVGSLLARENADPSKAPENDHA